MIATDKLALKEKVFAAIDAAYDELFDYAKSVAKEPEFGFKEFKTAKKVEAQFDKLDSLPEPSCYYGCKGLLKAEARTYHCHLRRAGRYQFPGSSVG